MNKKRSLVITFLAACALVQGASGQNSTVSGNLVLGTPSVTLQSWQPSSADNNLDPITTPGLGINGNLDITGNLLQMGSIYASQTSQTSTGPAVALWFNQFPGNQQPVTLSLDFQVPGVQYQWRDVSGASPKTRLSLDQTNLLSLYDTTGAIGLTLGASTGITISNPAAGVTVNDLTLSGKSSLNTLYNAAGTAVVRTDAFGDAIFSNSIGFGAVGSGSPPALQLNASNVAFLEGLLSHLGYQPNPSPGSDAATDFGSGLYIAGSALDQNGNAIICGGFTNSFSIGYNSLTATGSETAYVAKLSSSGSVLWAKSFGGTGMNYAKAVAVGPTGNIFVTGFCAGESSLAGKPVTSIGPQDAFVVMFDQYGNTQWAQIFGGAGSTAGTAITVDNQQRAWICGSATSSTVSFAGLNRSAPAGAANAECFEVEMSAANGAPIWANLFASSNSLSAVSVATDGNGNSYLSGSFAGNANFGTSGSNFPVASVTMPSGYPYTNVFIVKLDGNGNTLWTNALTGPSYESLAGTVADATGNLHIAGTYTSSYSIATTTVQSTGGADGFLVIINPAGLLTQATTVGGTSYDQVTQITVAPNGVTYLAGYFTGPAALLSGPSGNGVMALDATGTPLWVRVVPGYISDGAIASASTATGISVLLAGSAPYNAVSFGQEVFDGCFVYRWDGGSIPAPLGTDAPLAWGTSVARQPGSVALGSAAYAGGTNSFAGTGSIAEGSYSASFGGGVALSLNTLAFGNGATAGGIYSVALGEYNSAAGYGATALNYQTSAGGSYALSVGYSTHADSYSDLALGQFNVGGFSTGTNIYNAGNTNWTGRDPVLEIGNGTYSQRSNQLTVFKNGNLRVLGDVDVKGAMRTLPQGDLTMGPFTNQTNPNAKNPANISPTQGLRYPGE